MKRIRKNTDPFIEANKGKSTFEILNEFLEGREKYVQNDKSGTYKNLIVKEVVLCELNLYKNILKRIKGNSTGINNLKI
jgi:hypothetical protein